MAHALLSTTALALLLLSPSTDATCSYVQYNGVSFPTGQCVNSTTSTSGLATSKQYLCGGLLISKIFEYTYANAHCGGAASTKASLGACSAPTCECSVASSHCAVNTFGYDATLDGCAAPTLFWAQNLTIISDECVNGLLFSAADDARLVYAVYNDSDCRGHAEDMRGTCYAALHASDAVIETTMATTATATATRREGDGAADAAYDLKGTLMVGLVGVMVMGTLCSLGCMMRKYRGKRRRQVRAAEAHRKLLQVHDDADAHGDAELKAEGVVEVPRGEAELIEISEAAVARGPGVEQEEQEHEEEEEADGEDVPVAAYSDAFGNADEDGDEAADLSEGNEGVEVEEEQSE